MSRQTALLRAEMASQPEVLQTRSAGDFDGHQYRPAQLAR